MLVGEDEKSIRWLQNRFLCVSGLHSTFSPDCATTACHRVTSLRRKVPNSSAVLGRGTTPRGASFASNSGEPTTLRRAEERRERTSLGVAAGTTTAVQAETTRPGKPSSPKVGTLGKEGSRLPEAAASTSNRSLSARCSVPATQSRPSCPRPATRSLMAGALPLYGT